MYSNAGNSLDLSKSVSCYLEPLKISFAQLPSLNSSLISAWLFSAGYGARDFPHGKLLPYSKYSGTWVFVQDEHSFQHCIQRIRRAAGLKYFCSIGWFCAIDNRVTEMVFFASQEFSFSREGYEWIWIKSSSLILKTSLKVIHLVESLSYYVRYDWSI